MRHDAGNRVVMGSFSQIRRKRRHHKSVLRTGSYKMRKKPGTILLILISSALTFAFAGTAQAETTHADVVTFFNPDDSPADGHVTGHAILKRTHEGINLKVKTSELGPGNGYTLWWVIFNNPEYCDDGCNGPDLGNPDVEGSVMNATGRVADHYGDAMFSAFLPVGFMHTEPVSGNIRQVFGPGLQNLKGAEIHVVIRCHGPWSGNFEQISTLLGDCDNEESPTGCYDAQAIVFPLH